MPPKQQQPSKKTVDKAKQKVIEVIIIGDACSVRKYILIDYFRIKHSV